MQCRNKINSEGNDILLKEPLYITPTNEIKISHKADGVYGIITQIRSIIIIK